MKAASYKPLTLTEKIEARLSRKKGDVFLRADFEDLGSYDRVGVALRSLVRSGKLMKLGQGIYTRAAPSILDGKPVPVKGITAVMSEALKRLGIRTGPTKIERAYNARGTTQVPSGQLIGVNKRVRRKLGYGGSIMRFERVSRSAISRLANKATEALTRPPVPRIDAETERAARVFLKRIEDKYPFSDAILYGSRARGDHKPDSDADIAVVLKKGAPDKHARTDAAVDWAGIAFDVLMETGVKVNGFPVWAEELARPETFSNPALIDNILQDGIHL